MIAGLNHNFLLNNKNILNVCFSFNNEFKIEEFAFLMEDFQMLNIETAWIHSREDMDAIKEVIPKYPHRFPILIETK